MTAALSPTHRYELEQAFAIDPAVMAERGYRTIGREGRGELATLGIPTWALSSDQCFPGLLLPMYRATGEQITVQFKPATPVAIKGKPLKYVSVRGVNGFDVHPRNRAHITDLTVPLWITEGLKGDAKEAACRARCGLRRVYNAARAGHLQAARVETRAAPSASCPKQWTTHGYQAGRESALSP